MAFKANVKNAINEARTFRWQPTQKEIYEFEAHVRATGQPETFARITDTHVTKMDSAKICSEFEIDIAKRPDKDCAPCPICSPHSPKYKHGCLMWFPEEQCIRAVGRECGSAMDPEFRRKWELFYKKKTQDEIERFLEDNLRNVPSLIFELKEMHAAASEQVLFRKYFLKHASSTALSLRKHAKDGALKVEVPLINGNDGGRGRSSRKAKYETISFGMIRGHALFKSRCADPNLLLSMASSLKQYDFGTDAVETYTRGLCNLSEVQSANARLMIQKARKTINDFKEFSDDFCAFFDDKNIRKIAGWASHPNSEVAFGITFNSATRLLQIAASGDGTFWRRVPEVALPNPTIS